MGIYFNSSRGISFGDGNYKVLKIFRFGKLIKKLYAFGKKIYELSERKKYYCTWNIKPNVEGARVWINGEERSSATYEYIPTGGIGSGWIANGVIIERDEHHVSYKHGITYKVEAPGYHAVSGANEQDLLNHRPRENKVINVDVKLTRIAEYRVNVVVTRPVDSDIVTVTFKRTRQQPDHSSYTDYTEDYETIYDGTTSEGYLKYHAIMPVDNWAHIVVSATGYKNSDTVVYVDQERTWTTALEEESVTPEPTSYTKTLTYTPAIATTITSSNPNIKIERPSGNTGSATLTAPAGTVGNIFVTPTVTGYASYTFNDVAFNDSLGLSCALTSTSTYHCYQGRIQNMQGNIVTVYCYIHKNAGAGDPVYVSNTTQLISNKYFVEFAYNTAPSISNLIQGASFSGFATNPYVNNYLIVRSISGDNLTMGPSGLKGLSYSSFVRYPSNDL